MLLELQHLIALQKLETSVELIRTNIAELPNLESALVSRLHECSSKVEEATGRLTEHKKVRQQEENELAEVNTRLSRLKQQLMEVKTNDIYKAMLGEISNAEKEVKSIEDNLLERMLETDTFNSELEQFQILLTKEKTIVENEQKKIEKEKAAFEKDLKALEHERNELVSSLEHRVVSLFETVSKSRSGIAVAQAREGRCSCCQVRLRPQLFNDIRLNNQLIQCESCQRILYFEDQEVVSDIKETK
tara:strand:+ start:5500 stop:6237 length:738 start_codon:yes stop_codon:yes gene_type:complete